VPIFDYKCPQGHVFEKFFKTFKEAEANKRKHPLCPVCAPKFAPSELVEFSVPRPAMFYGNPDGWSRPSPTKRHSTKLVSAIEGNSSAVG